MRTIVAMLALAIAALASPAYAAGTGMPMMKGIKSPTELAALVEQSLASDPAGNKLLDPVRCKKNGSCATARDYFGGIQLAHPSAKLGDIAELPQYLRSLTKQSAPAGEWHISRLLVRGDKHTYDAKGWKRAFLQGESVWVDVNTAEPILAGHCGNVIGEGPTKPQPGPGPGPGVAVPVGPIGACPDVYILKVNVWREKALDLPGVESTHAKEEFVEKFIGVRVSRTHGKQFREAYADGKVARSATPRIFQVSLIMTPEVNGGPPTVTEEKVLGNLTVTRGLKELRFARAQLEKWDAIRVAAVNGDIVSPPPYHLTGLHELRFFNHLPGTRLGEWDANPVPDCIMNEHWIESE
ncbi:MAG: hypothetical protein WC217_00465 [Candidatus Paceibacterota bacterium]|jgi:hypothetical protein